MSKSTSFAILCLLLAGLMGCKRPLEHPEANDPVYRDLKKEAAKAFSIYKEQEKAAQSARKTFDEAPIRTGIRQDAQEEYFSIIDQKEKAAERYRYYTLKAELRKKLDLNQYPKYFKENKSWPDPSSYEEYEIEKRLASAPKEWNPENRMKKREPAQKKVEEEKSEGSE